MMDNDQQKVPQPDDDQQLLPARRTFLESLIHVAKEWVPSILIAFALWYVLSSFVIQSVRIPTGSMIPTIIPEDRVMVLKFLYFDELEHGDIIVFYPPIPGMEDTPYIKRLVGLPGDLIEVHDGALYRNGEKIEESYISAPMNYIFSPGKVPEDSYLFLGDNRNNSKDAHDPEWSTPFVKEDQIIGKALFRFFPLDRFGDIDKKFE
jgi:signal peptidase I